MSLHTETSIQHSEISSQHDEESFAADDGVEHEGPKALLEPKSLLDEPWRIARLPAPRDEEPRARRSSPWRRGDVTRLRDDSPEGMMRYIATHTTGWWQELAERALRDTEKARRMAEESGLEMGQYWSLEVDAEAREKLLVAEEARRQRDEAERAREQAEKEAFTKRQMELLEKAGKAPRCEYLYTDGRGCKAPQVKGERWCHGHAKTMSYRPERLELEPMEDEQAVMVNLHRVTKSLLSGRISEKLAGLMLWSVAIGAPGAVRMKQKQKHLPQMNADGRRSRRGHGVNQPGVKRVKSFKAGVDGAVRHPVIERSGEREIGKPRGAKQIPHCVRNDKGAEVYHKTVEFRRSARDKGNTGEGQQRQQRSKGGRTQRNHKNTNEEKRITPSKSTDLHTSAQGRNTPQPTIMRSGPHV
jgi:hypothetical protein